MHAFKGQGWTKHWRRRFDSSVYRNHAAYRVLDWLIDHAWPWPVDVVAGGEPLRLERGQLFVTYDEVAAGTIFETPKPVRSAFAFLKAKSIDWSQWPRKRPRGMVVTVLNYEEYQGSTPLLHGDGGEEGGDSAPEQGQVNGHADAQADSTEKGRRTRRKMSLSRKVDCNDERNGRAGKESESGQANGQAAGQAYIDQEYKNINPPTPFCKGGSGETDFDSSALLGSVEQCAASVLAAWRQEWAAAGKVIPEGGESGRDRDGALVLAKEYLQASRLNVAGLRLGMKGIIELIQKNPKCRLFDLKTLAKDPYRYGAAPVIEKEKKLQVRWVYVCNVCGHKRHDQHFVPAGEPPPPQPCEWADMRHCQGWMEPFVIQKCLV